MPVRMGGVISQQGFATPKGLGKSKWNKMRRIAGREVAQYYFDHMLPIRFTTEGERKLQYAPRSKPYTTRKTREKGHRNPMMWSGTSRDLALAGLNSQTIAVADRFRIDITLNTPALNLKSPKQKVKPSDEIRRITADEEEILNRVYAKSIERQLSEFDQTVKTTIS